MFPTASVFNLGESQFTYVSETHIKLNIGRFKARFCAAMARLRRMWTSAASQSINLEPGPSALRWLLGDDAADRAWGRQKKLAS